MITLWLLLTACNDGKTDTDDTDSDTDTEVSTDADTDDPDARWDDLRDILQTELEASDAPAMSIAIYEEGEVVFAEAYGMTEVDGNVPVTPSTLFQISTTTNIFTSVAVLQGVDQGLYAVGDDLYTLLPDLEARPNDVPMWEQTTLHRLMSQQTGMFDFIKWSEAPEDNRSNVSLVQYPGFSPFDNPPGRFFNFSYVNFSYAGFVREALEERDIADILEEDVFRPLGMARTTTRREDVAADGDFALGTGFVIEEDGSARALDVYDLADVPHPSFSLSAGTSTWSTPTEMTQLADFLLHGDPLVLSDTLRADITSPQVPLLSTADDARYGYGLNIRPGLPLNSGYRPTTAWEQGSFTLQYTSIFYVLPEHDYAVVILSSGRDTDFGSTLQAALELATNLPDVIDDPEYTVDPTRFADHVGSYMGPSNIRGIIVAEEDGGLVWTLPAYEAAGVIYERNLETLSSTQFIGSANDTDYEITFIGEPGSPSEFIRNRFWVATRTDTPSAAQPGLALPVDAHREHLSPSTRLMGSGPALTR
ncbi:MAG: CubicO group peptidase (beta-lactamase class C family) [Myxococcota bacterium]|jgi:CubicO group peptidase (beta-lactamase class C family)